MDDAVQMFGHKGRTIAGTDMGQSEGTSKKIEILSMLQYDEGEGHKPNQSSTEVNLNLGSLCRIQMPKDKSE